MYKEMQRNDVSCRTIYQWWSSLKGLLSASTATSVGVAGKVCCSRCSVFIYHSPCFVVLPGEFRVVKANERIESERGVSVECGKQ